MPRLLVLIPLFVWLLRPSEPADLLGALAGEAWLSAAMLVGGLFGVVVLQVAATTSALRATRRRHPPPGWSNYARSAAPMLLSAWLATCIWLLGWPAAVEAFVAPLPKPGGLFAPQSVELPLAVGPVYLAWAALLALDWPLVLGRLQRRVLLDVDFGEAPQPLPTFGRWWLERLRSRLGIVVVPLAIFWLFRDGAAVLVGRLAPGASSEAIEWMLLACSAIPSLFVCPWLVVRVLPTRPLEGPGGRPFEPVGGAIAELAHHAGLGRRGTVRVWDTGYTTANALAIGFVPRLRYVLMSDLLMAGMKPPHAQAVFAHEAGHVRHRHMAWFLVFFAALSLLLAGPLAALTDGVDAQIWRATGRSAADLPEWALWVASLLLLALAIALFGKLSRLFERQADVYAARVMQDLSVGRRARTPGPVGPEGAAAFAGALSAAMQLNRTFASQPRRQNDATDDALHETPPQLGVALIRRRAFSPRRSLDRLLGATAHFLHGSYQTRTTYLRRLSLDPTATRRFEQRVLVLKGLIAGVAIASLAWVAWA